MDKAKRAAEFSFDAGALTLDEVSRLSADMWADLPWDRDALARLKRDGLALDGVHISGACPYRFAASADGQMIVSAAFEQSAEMLIDLWRLHFLRGLRPHTLAA